MNSKTNNSASNSVPVDIIEGANRATLDLLPTKSREQYNIAYNRFIEWCKCKNVSGNYNETVLLAYFEEKSKIWKSSSLWSNYSMIKSVLSVQNNQDISKYYKLIAFLKRKAEGYRPKKSKIFTREQIDRFLTDAPDEKYLMLKVATIIGLFGACRREELCQMSVDNIEDLGAELVMNIPDTKTKIPRTFSIVGVSYIKIYRKYVALRPPHVTHRRFFIKYICNKCTCQPIGINTFGNMPTDIAIFLKLPDSSLFTGHCFRRSSASMLADSGVNLSTIKRHGGWKSSKVAEGYIEDSMEKKKEIVCQILPITSDNDIVSSSNNCSMSENISTAVSSSACTQGINVNNCTNCTISINVLK